MKVLGIDLGGTNVSMGVVNEEGKIVKKLTIETRVSDGFESVIQRISEASLKLIESIGGIDGVGVGSPGSIEHERGIVRFSPNFPDWIDVPLASELEKRIGVKVVVENDANAFVVGEKWFGSGKGYTDIIGITLGTGVGGGVISNGQLLRGSTGIGAELGHIVVEPNGYICGCGNHGCLETIASATGISRLAKEWKERYPKSSLVDFSAKSVMKAAQAKDPLGLKVLERVSTALGIALGNLIHIFNPQLIVIGGGVSRAGEVLLSAVKRRTRENVMRSFWGTYEIVLSDLVDDAGIYGAASMGFEEIKSQSLEEKGI